MTPRAPSARVAREAQDVRRRPAGAATEVVDVVVLVGALTLALAPLLPVYGNRAALTAIGGGLALGTAVAAVGAWRRWTGLGTVAVLVLVYFGAGGAFAVPGSTTGGVLPTGRTLADLASGAVTSWKQVLTLEPPLGTAGNLLVVPFLLALIGATTALAITWAPRRRSVRASGALVPPVVLLVSIVLGTRTTVRPVETGLVLSVVLVLWAAWRTGRLQARRLLALALALGVGVAGGAVGGAAVTGATPRFVLRDEITPPFDPRDYRSPLSGFRTFVKEDKDKALLTVTGLPKGATVRLATMDSFDGVVWNVAGHQAAEGSGGFRRVGQTIAEQVRGPQARIGIQIQGLSGVWLPTAGNALEFGFSGSGAAASTAALRYNDATGAAVLTDGLHDGVSYTLDTVLPSVPDDTTIGSAGAADVTVPPAVGVPEVVGTRAAEIARSAGSPVLVARSLQKALMDGGYFSNGQTVAGDYPSLAGHGADRVAALLDGSIMVGDSEQYASAMALMARQMGLPARVVLGFVPSESQDGAASITFTGAQAQAWVEIAFSGYGWVPFFPTPPESQTPQKDTQAQKPEPNPQVLQPPPPPVDPVTAPQDDTEQPQTDSAPREAAHTSVWRTVGLVAAIGGVPLLIVGLPIVVVLGAKRRRRRRRRADPDPVLRVAGGWQELVDAARDHGRPPPELSTRREVAVVLGSGSTGSRGRAVDELPPADRGQLLALAERADEAVFGGHPPADPAVAEYWALVSRAVAALGAGLPRRRRIRARLSWASLRRRR